MSEGGITTRVEGVSRAKAITIIAAVLLIFMLTLGSMGDAPVPKLRQSVEQQNDAGLYRTIVEGVRAGGGYYEVAAEQLRAGNYPLKPFLTFRLPTLAVAEAQLGPLGIGVAMGALCVAVLVAWWRRLRPLQTRLASTATLVLMFGGMAAMVQPVTALFHEGWTALLLALMIALYDRRRAWPAMVAAGAALMIRELALPMILAMGGLALLARRWREAAGWAAVVALFAAYLALHAGWVAAVVQPGDPPSPGWSGLAGPGFALNSLAKITIASAFPPMLASALFLLSLLGWIGVKADWALRVSILLLGYGAMLALFARPDTFYWALMAAPLSLAGLAFVPTVARDLVKAVATVPHQQP